MIYYFEGLFIYDCSSRLFDVVDESIFERYRASTKPRTREARLSDLLATESTKDALTTRS
jgi:hypothetical protein